MKSLASAIVVLAGTYGIATSMPVFLVRFSVIPFIGLAAGMVTLALGLVGWWASLKYDR